MTSFFDVEEGSNKSLIGELFGDNKKRSKTTFDDLLSNISSNNDQEKSLAKGGITNQKQAFQSSDLNLSLPSQTRKNPINKDLLTGLERNAGTESSDTLDELFQTNKIKSNKSTKSVNFANALFNNSSSNVSNTIATNKPILNNNKSISSTQDINDEHVKMLEQTISLLKKEISSLKYDIRSTQDEAEEWKTMYEKLQKKYTKDINDLKESHEHQLEEINIEHKKELKHQIEVIEKEAQIKAIKETDNEHFNELKKQLEKAFFTIDTLKNELNFVTDSFKEYQENTRNIFKEQLELQQEQFGEEAKIRTTEKQDIEHLYRNLKIIYEEQKRLLQIERSRLEEDRRKLRTDIEHFKKTQLEILDKIENQKIELEKLKANFLTKQHDLLVRVMNERSYIEEENQKFQMQKSMDISRIRSEAEVLEKYAREIENARIFLEDARIKYEQKNQKLNEIEKILLTECVKLEKIKIKMNDNYEEDFNTLENLEDDYF
uniref:TACC_C domain-containing protein n=1 Tax=Strongyloides stercoralis TaxID=6248 RepID=A0A0K0EL91_STRER